LTTVRNTYYGFGGSSEANSGEIRIPAGYGVGLVVEFREKLLVGSDYFFQPWSRATVDGATSGLLADEQRIGFGAQTIPRSDAFASYLQRLVFRIGFYSTVMYFKDRQGNRIREDIGTVGLGLPFFFGAGRLDLAFEYGRRGRLPMNPVEEKVFRFLFSVTGGEKWFVRKK
jgi:hypothetical protein